MIIADENLDARIIKILRDNDFSIFSIHATPAIKLLLNFLPSIEPDTILVKKRHGVYLLSAVVHAP
jgi:hypothetical protein